MYNEFGMLSSDDFEFEKIPEWDAWQKEEIAKLPIVDEEIELISHPNQIMTEISKDHSEAIVGEGTLSLTNKALCVGDKRIPLSEIRGYDIFFHGFLLVSTKDKKYYEISNKKCKYPGYLYKLLLDKYIVTNN